MSAPRFFTGQTVVGIMNGTQYRVTGQTRMFLHVVDADGVPYCERKKWFAPK